MAHYITYNVNIYSHSWTQLNQTISIISCIYHTLPLLYRIFLLFFHSFFHSNFFVTQIEQLLFPLPITFKIINETHIANHIFAFYFLKARKYDLLETIRYRLRSLFHWLPEISKVRLFSHCKVHFWSYNYKGESYFRARKWPLRTTILTQYSSNVLWETPRNCCLLVTSTLWKVLRTDLHCVISDRTNYRVSAGLQVTRTTSCAVLSTGWTKTRSSSLLVFSSSVEFS